MALWLAWERVERFQAWRGFLKEQNPAVITVAVETEGSILQGGAPGKHRVEGIGVHFVPETFHREVCDRVVMVER